MNRRMRSRQKIHQLKLQTESNNVHASVKMLSIRITTRALNFISHIFIFHYVCSPNHVNGIKLPNKHRDGRGNNNKQINILFESRNSHTQNRRWSFADWITDFLYRTFIHQFSLVGSAVRFGGLRHEVCSFCGCIDRAITPTELLTSFLGIQRKVFCLATPKKFSKITRNNRLPTQNSSQPLFRFQVFIYAAWSLFLEMIDSRGFISRNLCWPILDVLKKRNKNSFCSRSSRFSWAWRNLNNRFLRFCFHHKKKTKFGDELECLL